MIKINRYALIFATAALAFSSCKPEETTEVQTENYKGVVVVNEGGFNKSNGSLGLYKPGTKTYFDAFKKANDRPLGDVVQSIASINDKYYVVVNNSNKVEVINQSDFKSVAVVNTTSPRYVLKVSDKKAYISNLYSNTIKVLDLISNTITKNIDINDNSEQMAISQGYAYVNTYSNKIKIVKVDSDSLRDSISTGKGLSKIINVSSNTLAVLATGDVDWNSGAVKENGNLYILRSDSLKISKTFPLNTGSYGGSLIYTGGYLYYSLGDNKVNKVDISSGTTTTFITLTGTATVYSLTTDSNGRIYVTNAADFNSAGTVYVYASDGTKLYEFNAGIAPNAAFSNE